MGSDASVISGATAGVRGVLKLLASMFVPLAASPEGADEYAEEVATGVDDVEEGAT